jgi:uncharacterized protein (TIGR02391 family)
MADLNTSEKQLLEKLFQMEGGYVLNFSDRTMDKFFRDDIGIDIKSQKYSDAGWSKANRLKSFWLKEDNGTVGKAIHKLIEYIESQILTAKLQKEDFPVERINSVKQIAQKLLEQVGDEKKSFPRATFKNGNISIALQKEIFDHVQKLLDNGHFSNAVEESYKIVRQKLKDITGREKATEAFSQSNIEKIFGHQPRNDPEKDFFEGVKFLHMSIQFLRNEKAHTPARDLDKNLAIHYISLASLAYGLITRR